MKEKNLTCAQARNLCIVKSLAKLGHFPSRTTEKEAWFLSPLRTETNASFKVSLKLNRWYDFGTGEGGNLLDLIVAMKTCSVKQALEFLNDEKMFFSFQQPLLKSDKPAIAIVKIKPIENPALIQYLESRKIPIQIARNYCREVWYRNKGRQYFALGLQNHLGAWELRNKFYKTSTSPKTYSMVKRGSKRLLITEGMFDFLSLATREEQLIEHSDCIILNSMAFIGNIKVWILEYDEVSLYLDNDCSGKKAASSLLKLFDNIIDCSDSYRNYKDLNEKLMSENSSAGRNMKLR